MTDPSVTWDRWVAGPRGQLLVFVAVLVDVDLHAEAGGQAEDLRAQVEAEQRVLAPKALIPK
jgi:hypothetical protein